MLSQRLTKPIISDTILQRRRISMQRMSALNFEQRTWPLLLCLKQSFILKISKVIILPDQHALIVTKDKTVYAFYKNSALRCLEYVKVLCNKDIKTVAYCYISKEKANMILTEDGEVYMLDFHDCFGYHDINHIVQRINMPSDAKRIVDIACGSEHFLVLAEDGKVYAWESHTYMYYEDGKNYSNQSRYVPRHISANLAGKKVVCISCGEESSTVVTDDGEVYSWGNNVHGQLGLGDNTNRVHACRLDTLTGIKIVKVACGRNHTLALTDDAKLYVWGYISGQLDTGTIGRKEKTPSLLPQDIMSKMERIVHIAAISYRDISIAIGETGRIYVWGHCTSIRTTPCTCYWSMYDLFAYYVWPCVMQKPVITQFHNDMSPVVKWLHSIFNDSETSDFTIMVEDKPIYVHKTILKIRSSYFRNMLKHEWKENKENIVKYNMVSYEAYKAFLQYLYTETFDALSVETTIEVLKLADAYCQSDLKRNCVDVLQKRITRENVVRIYEASIMYNAKELKEMLVKHFRDVVEGVNCEK